MNDKPLRAEIPFPAGATPREEAATVEEDAQFQAILRLSREQSERGEEISINEVLDRMSEIAKRGTVKC